jgi:redox-sensitive bicupin YhaK (pirin superfamily)
LQPGYEQKHFADRAGRLRLVGSSDGRDGSVTIHQDVALYAAVLAPGETVEHEAAPGRSTWIHVARGSATANGIDLVEGDAAATADPGSIALTARDAEAEILLFDLA